MKLKKLTIWILAAVLLTPFSGASAYSLNGRDGVSPTASGLALAFPTWQQVNSNGFGDPQTGEVTALESFSGYLYAGTHNPIDPAQLFDGAQIFRSVDGLSWTAVTQPGFGNSHDTAPTAILDFVVFNGYLYAGTGRRNASQLWRSSSGLTWAPMDVTGFSDPDNVDITVLAVYNGMIYAGVTNRASGAQIWHSYTGDNNSWTQMVAPGLADSKITGMAEFDGGLYAAVESPGPAQLWLSYGTDWTAVVTDGFGDNDTLSTGGMAVFGGYLYVGAGSATSGAQLWRTNNGTTWVQMITPGFGDPNNLKVESVFVFQNRLYASVRNTASGLELWRSPDGLAWEQANPDGFGDSHNTGTNLSNSSENFLCQLYVGTENLINGGELWRMQKAYGVSLSADQAKTGSPGQTVTYDLTITNTGSMADSYALAAGGQTWTTSLSTSLVNLAPSASTNFTVSVTIPAGAPNQATDSATITAASQAEQCATDAATLTTTSSTAPVYGVALSADESKSGPAGSQVTYTLTVTNTGNAADTFDLLPGGNAWTTTLSTQTIALAAGGSGTVTITVSIPPSAAALVSDQVSIQAKSQHDASKTDTAVLTTVSTGPPNRSYLPIVNRNIQP